MIAKITKRKKSHKDDKRYLAIACKAFGHKKLDKVTRTDISTVVKELSEHGNTYTTANRFHASIRTCLEEAVPEHIAINPERKV